MRLLNPCKLDETGVIEVPLTPSDPGYQTTVPLAPGQRPITVASKDLTNGEYSMEYTPVVYGVYSLVIRSLEQGGLLGQYWDNQWFFGLPSYVTQVIKIGRIIVA